jgi:hypothetical protein
MSTHRRRFLRLWGVAGLGAVAGCSGGSGDGETPADSETTTGPTDSLEQEAKLAADDGDSDDEFSCSVALSGDGSTALVGTWSDEDPNGDLAGSAYVFNGRIGPTLSD